MSGKEWKGKRKLISIKDCGLMLEPQQGMSVEEIIGWAEYAERNGYGFILRSDHLLPTFGEKNGIDSPECWTTLGAIASKTDRIKFGPLVSPVGFRNPALLCRMARTLHEFSRGRLVLGVGAGWYKDEYNAHGIEFGSFQARKEKFAEAVRGIIRPLTLAMGKVEFEGRYYKAHIETLPELKHGKIHLIIGGASESIARLASEYADEWNLFSPTIDSIKELKQTILHEKFKEYRREEISNLEEEEEKKKIEISQMGTFVISNTRSGFEQKIEVYKKRRNINDSSEVVIKNLRARGIICGTSEEVIAEIVARNNAGVDKFYFQIIDTKDREMVDTLTETLRSRL